MDVFDLYAKISADASGYDKALDSAKSKGESFLKGIEGAGGKVKGAFGAVGNVLGGIGDAAMKFGQVAAVGVGAVATGISAMAVQSLNAYKEYEQLVGGVNKLYGNMGMSLEEYAQYNNTTTEAVKEEWQSLENAQTMVLDNAKQAYKTVGMSANQYMEVATSFSAALINDLGDQEAAALRTDLAMRAIGDNVNTFGSSMDSVQNAFMGFAKQNYTMLDNLKLGYGGTKKEMERLVADANEYAQANGMAAELTVDSFADIVTAIDLIQQKQGIAGTTAREAATTIEGSLNMLKGAWTNLVAGFSNPDADLGQLMNDLVESATTAFDNLLPAIEQGLGGITQFIGNIAPLVGEYLPQLVNKVLPLAVDAFKSIIQALITAVPQILPTLFTAIMDVGSAVAEVALDLMRQAADALEEYDWAALAQNIIDWLSDVLNSDTTQGLIEAGLSIISSLGEGIIQAAPVMLDAFTQLLNNATAAINDFDWADAAQNVVDFIVNALTSDSTTGFLDAAVSMIEALVNGLIQAAPVLFDGALEILELLASGLSENVTSLLTAAIDIMTGLSGFLAENVSPVIEVGADILSALVEGIFNAIPTLLEQAPVIINNLITAMHNGSQSLAECGTELIMDIIAGIIETIPELVAHFPEMLQMIVDVFTAFNPISLGIDIIKGIKKGVEDKAPEFVDRLKKAGEDALEKIKNAEWFQQGKEAIDKIVDGISSVADNIKKKIEEIVKKVKEFWEGFNWVALGEKLVNGIVEGIKNLGDSIGNTLQGLAENAWNKVTSFFNSKGEGGESGRGGSSGTLNSAPRASMAPTGSGISSDLFATPVAVKAVNAPAPVLGSGLDEVAEGAGLDALGEAIVNAFVRANITVEYDDRELGRLVRKLGVAT